MECCAPSSRLLFDTRPFAVLTVVSLAMLLSSSVFAQNKPTLGAKIGDTAQTQAGIVRDRREITDINIKPMYQDEWALGVQHAWSKKYKLGLRGIMRDFGYAIDMIVNHALVTWARANGYPNYVYSGPSSRAYVSRERWPAHHDVLGFQSQRHAGRSGTGYPDSGNARLSGSGTELLRRRIHR